MKNILYLSYTPTSTALGRSQVVSYIKKLSMDNEITLFSFENEMKSESLRQEFHELGVNWKTFPIYKSKLLRGLFFIYFTFYTCMYSLKNKIDILHCRSYFMGGVGYFVKFIFNKTFIFDIRGFWFHELRENGRMSNPILFRISIFIQRKLFNKCDALITLTESSLDKINLFADKNISDKVYVIPTCVDLDKFNIPLFEKKIESIKVSYIGNTQERYKFNAVLDFMVALNKSDSKIVLDIVTKEPNVAEKQINDRIKNPIDINVISLDFNDMPSYLQSVDMAVFFTNETISALAMAPTKFGELLASGVYCIVNDNGADVSRIVSETRCGKVIHLDDEHSFSDFSLDDLSNRPSRLDIRKVAELYFDINTGVEKINAIYNVFSR